MSLDALIVDPDLQSRMRLKQVAMSSCKTVQLASTLREGLERLGGEQNCDALYLSTRFDMQVASDFLQKGKETIQGRDAAYILILSPETQKDAQMVAKILLAGFDGSLSEPCSVDAFVESTRLAAQLKGVRKLDRMQGAIKITISGIAKEIDAISLARKHKMPAIRAEAKLKELMSSIHSLPPELHEFYFSSMTEQFDQIRPPEVYSGVSKRVQQRMIRRVTQ